MEASLGIHAGLDVGIQPAGGVSQGGIQVGGALLQQALWILVELGGIQHRGLGRLPGLPGQQLRPGVGQPGRGRGEDVARIRESCMARPASPGPGCRSVWCWTAWQQAWRIRKFSSSTQRSVSRESGPPRHTIRAAAAYGALLAREEVLPLPGE